MKIFIGRVARTVAGVAVSAVVLLAPVAVVRNAIAQTDEGDPVASTVAAVDAYGADVYSKTVLPCREKNEAAIAVERQREESCADCQSQLPQLAIAEQQAMARCDVKGYNLRIADIDARIDAVMAQLKELGDKFDALARSNEVLTNEIEDGETEAKATFTEAAVGRLMEAVLSLPAEEQIEAIEKAEKRLKDVKAVSRVTKAELGAFVAEMRKELAGKTKAEAKVIVEARLKQVMLLADGVKGVNALSSQNAAHSIAVARFGAKTDVSGERLDQAYSVLLTSLQIAVDQSKKKVEAMIRLNHVLGYSEDAVKIAIVFKNIGQLGDNVDGLSSLVQAAESQRKIAKAKIDYLVMQRKALVEQGGGSERASGQ